MILAENGIEPPKEWYHESLITDNSGKTVAMYIACYCCKIPDEYWYHSPT